MPVFNSDLVTDVARRRAVLFLGSGVSASARTRAGTRVRDWESFLDHAANLIQDTAIKDVVKNKILEKDFLLACEIIKQNLEAEEWRDLIYREFSQIAEPSPLHKAIVSLDPRIIITTNFDKMVESAFPILDQSAENYPVTISKLDPSVFQSLRDDRRYIIKLHGSIDGPNDMIFSKADYIQNAFGNRIYSDFVEAVLTSFTVIFIGFSMSDPAIALLIERHVQKYPNLRPHYIFQQEPIDRSVEDVSRRLRRLHPIRYAAGDGHDDLPIKIEELRIQAEVRRKELIADATVKATSHIF